MFQYLHTLFLINRHYITSNITLLNKHIKCYTFVDICQMLYICSLKQEHIEVDIKNIVSIEVLIKND